MSDAYPYLLTFHIAVLGYWLGAELVINSSYRFVCRSASMSMPERDRLMTHVMNVDQHVRYALILQLGLGVMLGAIVGFLPGAATTLAIGAGVTLLWLAFVEWVHRARDPDLSAKLAMLDRFTRYALLVLLLAIASGLIADHWPLPPWLRWKLGLFAGVIACGVGIRVVLLRHFSVWEEMLNAGSSPKREEAVRRNYVRATGILGILWTLIAGITLLSILQPTA